jgi:hypothetical protein
VSVSDWHISVPASANPPHVIKKDINALVNGKQKMLARTGDIYVRHSSKTEIATHDDIHRMFQITLSFWLSKIGQAVQTLSLDVQEGQLALPVQLSEDTTALKIGVADPNKDFPYNATLIGRKLGKSSAWVAEAIKKLEIKKNPLLALGINGSKGEACLWKYNERALRLLQEKLEKDPAYHPYGPRRPKQKAR